MSSWSQNRKLLYGGGVVVVIVASVIIPGFLYFYKAPTCFDGIKNGNETGVDCGGSCQRLCQSAFLPPNAAWTRFEKVAPGLYNMAAYIVNPNLNGEAANVPYHFQLYDNKGVIITDVSGTMTLPPHRNALAFLGAVNVTNRVPAKALFEFTAAPDWHSRNDPLSMLSVTDKNYTEDNMGSSLSVTLKNTSFKDALGRMDVYVVLYDKDNNAIGFSKTVIDGIGPQGIVMAPFTWPVNRGEKVISIEVLPVMK